MTTRLGKGWRPSPKHKLGLGAIQGLSLLAASLPDRADVALPDALEQSFEDCVGNSTAIATCHAVAVALGRPTGPWPELPSRAWIYALARITAGQSLNEDDGTYIHAAFEAMADDGFPPESAWLYGPEHLTMAPDWAARRAAADQKLIKGARRIISTGQHLIQDVATAIANGSVVCWGTELDEAFETLGVNDVWPGVTGPTVGGHAMVLHRLRHNALGRLEFASRSSWGRSFADNGSAWVDQAAIASPDADDFWLVETAPVYSKELA